MHQVPTPHICCSSCYPDGSGSTCFQEAVLADSETSADTWEDLAGVLQDQGYTETGLALLAATTVLAAMKAALRTSQELPPPPETENMDGGTESGPNTAVVSQ